MRPDIESLCSEAHGHYEKGHYEDARRTYAAALNAAHAEPELESHVLRERVATLMAMQLPQLALGDAINSVLLSPSCDGYYGIGRTQLAMGLLANAVGMLSAASRMAPDRGDVREMLEEAQARHESQQSAGDRSTIRYDFWFPKQQPRSRDDNISWIRERIRNLAAPVECVHVGANGRSLVATEPIAKDTLIFAEFPFASGTANSSVCSSCFRELPMPHITCEHCEHERYCSTSCQVRAWQQYHRKLCTRDERLAQLRVYCREKHSKEDASTLMLILRLAGIALSAPEPSGPENGVATPPPPENLADVLAHPGIAHFQNLTEVEDADLRSEAICHSLRNMDLRANDFVQLRTLFAEFLDLRAFDFEWFWNMHFIIKCNAFGALHGEGSTLYAVGCMINHSCNPNCRHSSGDDSSMVVYADRDIAAGEELSICYGSNPAGRRSWLRRTFAFDCDCKACVEGDLAGEQYQGRAVALP